MFAWSTAVDINADDCTITSCYLNQVVAPSCWDLPTLHLPAVDATGNVFALSAFSSASDALRPLPLKPGDSLNCVGVFSFGTNLIMSDVNPQINYEQSPLHCHSLVDFSIRKKRTRNDCLQSCRVSSLQLHLEKKYEGIIFCLKYIYIRHVFN